MQKPLSAKYILFLLLALSFAGVSFGQKQKKDTIAVAFWNLENLFDTVDDPNKEDEEFLPAGNKEWTEERLDKKFYNLARIIRSMNNNKGPDILGVCEVEHQALLEGMISKFLKEKNYKTAYAESPDNRGIDNGLIFNADKFELLSVYADTVLLSDNYPTRLILNVNLVSKIKDTLHVFINHWPSRRGGQAKSEKNRIAAAKKLREMIENLFMHKPGAKILCIGDFNDEPGDISITEYLKAEQFKCDSLKFTASQNGRKLFNLAYQNYLNDEGSYNFQNDWNMLDQIIISSSLITSKSVRYICGSFEIYRPPFMVTQTGKFKGTPFPTYGGNRYLGGYSDHFPVIAKFVMKGN